MKKVISLILAFVMCLSMCACGSTENTSEATTPPKTAETTEASEITESPIVRLTKNEAKAIFDSNYEDFVKLIDDLSDAIDYWNDNDFTTLDDIHTYENMWQSMADTARAIQDSMLKNLPLEMYEADWNQFAEYMSELATILEKGTNMNTNGDSEYTGDEMATLIREISSEFVDIAYIADDLATEIKTSFEENNSSDSNSGHTCTECGKNAPHSYTNPFSGGIEYYCETHYQEIIDMMGEMEEDVGQSSQSKHTCEQCNREGTHRYDSFTGQTEYYCTQHYEELMEMLESFGLD